MSSGNFTTTDIVEMNSLVTPGESIMVINTIDQASDIQPATSSIKSDGDAFEALKHKFNELKWKYDECFKDNLLLKNQCDYLNRKIEDFKTTQHFPDYAADFETFEKNESIVAYVEVSNICLSNKIETYLAETNNMFTSDKEAAFDSMAFFVKNMWSLIAHKYSENSLEQSLLVKDQLIDKLMKAKQELLQINEKSFQDQQTINNLNIDVEEFNANSEIIKSRVMEQNSVIKKLIEQLDTLKSYSIVSSNQNQNLDQENSIQPTTSGQEITEPMANEDENSFSPGSSPSSFFLNRFQKKLSTLTKGKTTGPLKNSKLTPQDIKATQKKESTDDFYIYNFQNDFIAIDKTLNESNEMIKSIQGDTVQTTEFSTLISDTSSMVCSLYTCNNCRTSVDANKCDKSRMDKHARAECKTSNVCMFCLDLFDLSLQEEFEKHVRSHISLETCDT